MSGIGAGGLAVLALVDEPGVLGEAAGIEEERDPEPVAHGADGAQVGERDGLAATAVVGDRDEDRGHVLGAALGQEGLERRDVHVPLERMERRRDATLGDDQVDRLGAGVLDVGAGRVEMGVVGDGLSGATDGREQDLLGGPALVRRDDVFEREERLDRLEERIP